VLPVFQIPVPGNFGENMHSVHSVDIAQQTLPVPRDRRGIPSKTAATVLVIDDDALYVRFMKLTLEEHGYRARTAASGEAGLQSVQENRPDIILLDLVMPDLDGYEVCRRLKADPLSTDIPVIFLSGFGSPQEKVRAFEAGGVDYIVKPYSRIELLARLRTHLALQRMRNNLAKEVRKRTAELEEKNQELQETNIVLKRLLGEIEQEKKKLGRIMQLNIERLILPDLDRTVQAPAEERVRLRNLIRSNLLDLVRPLGCEREDIYSLLTPTDLRVLNLIRRGKRTKEIAELLTLSPQTVATHRKNIRKKLNLSGKKINLASFLKQGS
jgi:DNA-binding response OmpR family regulator/DNA-binding CsgD family transcriptional regulator